MKKTLDTASRRTFVATSAAGAATLATTSSVHAEPTVKVDVWMIHGEDKRALMAKAMDIIAEQGGVGAKGGTLALKVNAAWGRDPDVGANTHPDLVDVFIERAKATGVKKITIPEHPCNSAKIAFEKSGIQEVAKKHKCKMIDLKKVQKSYRGVDVPEGRSLKSVEVAGEYLDADSVVNIPIAKHHGGATVSCAMKNWMGIVKDRRWWHRNDLHQCIADFCTVMKPTWTIVDATRCMLDHGPQGPAKELKHPNRLIVSRDQVAADACIMDIFDHKPHDIKYLKYADEMGIGVIDSSKMNIHEINLG